MKSTTISLDKKYEIEELPLGQYRTLFKKIRSLYDKVSDDIGTLQDTNILEALPLLLDKAWDETLDLISFATGVPVDTLENKTGMGGLIQCWDAIIEVNDIDLLKKRLAPLFKTQSSKLQEKLEQNTAGAQAKSSKSPKAKQ